MFTARVGERTEVGRETESVVVGFFRQIVEHVTSGRKVGNGFADIISEPEARRVAYLGDGDGVQNAMRANALGVDFPDPRS